LDLEEGAIRRFSAAAHSLHVAEWSCDSAYFNTRKLIRTAFAAWFEVRRTINDVDHQTDLLGGSGNAERTQPLA
jgi:hypothetical protein